MVAAVTGRRRAQPVNQQQHSPQGAAPAVVVHMCGGHLLGLQALTLRGRQHLPLAKQSIHPTSCSKRLGCSSARLFRVPPYLLHRVYRQNQHKCWQGYVPAKGHISFCVDPLIDIAASYLASDIGNVWTHASTFCVCVQAFAHSKDEARMASMSIDSFLPLVQNPSSLSVRLLSDAASQHLARPSSSLKRCVTLHQPFRRNDFAAPPCRSMHILLFVCCPLRCHLHRSMP